MLQDELETASKLARWITKTIHYHSTKPNPYISAHNKTLIDVPVKAV